MTLQFYPPIQWATLNAPYLAKEDEIYSEVFAEYSPSYMKIQLYQVTSCNMDPLSEISQ